MSKVWITIVIVIVVTAGYFMLMGGNKDMFSEVDQVMPTISENQMDTVVLAEQNESGESGTAVLVEVDGKVVVTLNTVGALADVPQPAHIHTGVCPDVGGIAYPLTNVVNGVSQTTLDVTLAELAAQQPLGINIHKSVPESAIYVSCGDLAL